MQASDLTKLSPLFSSSNVREPKQTVFPLSPGKKESISLRRKPVIFLPGLMGSVLVDPKWREEHLQEQQKRLKRANEKLRKIKNQLPSYGVGTGWQVAVAIEQRVAGIKGAIQQIQEDSNPKQKQYVWSAEVLLTSFLKEAVTLTLSNAENRLLQRLTEPQRLEAVVV